MVILNGLNNVRRTHFIINHENDYVNEDATLCNNDDNNIITSNIQNGISIFSFKQILIKYLEPNVQLIVNERNSPQTVVDDLTCKLNNIFRYHLIKLISYLKDNINAVSSVEPQDYIYSSDEEGTVD